MKKITIIILAMFCFLLLAACPKDNSNIPNDNDKTYTATVVAPQGWSSFTDNYTLLRYRKGSADTSLGDFWSRKPVKLYNLDSTISSYKETEESGGYTFVWETVKDVQVNGIAAKNLDYKATVSDMTMQYNVYFIPKDGYVFIVVCLTNPAADYDVYKNDFQAFLSSFTIVEA